MSIILLQAAEFGAESLSKRLGVRRTDGVEEREATNEHKDFKAAVAEVAIN